MAGRHLLFEHLLREPASFTRSFQPRGVGAFTNERLVDVADEEPGRIDVDRRLLALRLEHRLERAIGEYDLVSPRRIRPNGTPSHSRYAAESSPGCRTSSACPYSDRAQCRICTPAMSPEVGRQASPAASADSPFSLRRVDVSQIGSSRESRAAFRRPSASTCAGSKKSCAHGSSSVTSVGSGGPTRRTPVGDPSASPRCRAAGCSRPRPPPRATDGGTS